MPARILLKGLSGRLPDLSGPAACPIPWSYPSYPYSYLSDTI